ncbi:hypothetical protein ACFWUW_14490 [Streptomyces sp. NPDC058655]|uniref:hypothetical protein n=1 Tax=Streptomyces sp. NPDC058655 TaxID=3346577 RepID=UPI003665CA6C
MSTVSMPADRSVPWWTRGRAGLSALRPPGQGARLLEKALAVVTGVGRRPFTGGGVRAVCEAAGGYRSYSGGPGGAVPADPAGPGRADDVPGGADRRERADRTVASRATGPDDLASLLEMLDLRHGRDGKAPQEGPRRGRSGG